MNVISILFWIVGCVMVGVVSAKAIEMMGHKTISKGIITLTTVVTFGSIAYLIYGVVSDIVNAFYLFR